MVVTACGLGVTETHPWWTYARGRCIGSREGKGQGRNWPGVRSGSAGITGWRLGWITMAMGMGQHWPGGLEPPLWLGGITDRLSLQDHKEWMVGEEQSTKLTTPPCLPSAGKGGRWGRQGSASTTKNAESQLLGRKVYLQVIFIHSWVKSIASSVTGKQKHVFWERSGLVFPPAWLKQICWLLWRFLGR